MKTTKTTHHIEKQTPNKSYFWSAPSRSPPVDHTEEHNRMEPGGKLGLSLPAACTRPIAPQMSQMQWLTSFLQGYTNLCRSRVLLKETRLVTNDVTVSVPSQWSRTGSTPRVICVGVSFERVHLPWLACTLNWMSNTKLAVRGASATPYY
eukprot:5242506-Amphidinium_carterae.1